MAQQLKNNVIDDEKELENSIGSTVNDIASGLTYHLYPIKGLITDKKYLSCSHDGKIVDLWPCDDNSGRQKWILNQIGMENKNAIYHAQPFDGLFDNNGRYLVSCGDDGKVVNLWNEDDESGRQQWVFFPIGRDPKTNQPVFNIKPSGGVNIGQRKWLSAGDDGNVVNLWDEDDDSGRQQWVVVPTDMQIESIDYHIDAGKILNTSPMALVTQRLENKTGSPQAMKFTVDEEVVNESTFNNTAGISLTIGTTFKCGIPVVDEYE